MNLIYNCIKSIKTIPQNFSEINKKGWKKTWTEERYKIKQLATKIFAFLSLILATTVIIALPIHSYMIMPTTIGYLIFNVLLPCMATGALINISIRILNILGKKSNSHPLFLG